ncbi:hypothetical protein C0992_006518 [Termitomyces sp. T32_za158]|nr:hypothetical protein C0992_006518 [Termitomyces sp. T32_za158]
MYTPEATIPTSPSPSVVNNAEQGLFYEDQSADSYRDGIHPELREPSVRLDLSGHVHPADVFHEDILKARATSSSQIDTFLIYSRSLPWEISVPYQNGCLTVENVLDAIIESLQRPVAANDLYELRRTNGDLFLRVLKRRKRRLQNQNLLEDDDTSARWIDWLPSRERVFLGLSSEQGVVGDSTERTLKVTSYLSSL